MPFIRNRIALVSYHRKIVDALEGLHQYATSRTTVDIYTTSRRAVDIL